MFAALLAFVIGAAGAGAVAWALLERRRADPLEPRPRVLVNLKTDKAVDGVLWERSPSLLVLKDARLFEGPGREPIHVDGDVLIERGNVDFVQVFPTPEV